MLGRKKKQSNGRPEPPQTPLDADLFGGPLADEPALRDIFSSLVDFTAEPDLSVAKAPPAPRFRPMRPALHLDRLSNVQKLLLLGIVIVAAGLAYTLASTMGRKTGDDNPREQRAQLPAVLGPPSVETSAPQRPPWDVRSSTIPPLATTTPTQPGMVDVGGGSQVHSGVYGNPEPSIPSPEPLSLQLANRLYLNREYEHAFVTYDKLYRRLPGVDGNQSLRDFLLLRMALCSKKMGDAGQAETLFRTVSLSRLPILRALARYYQGTMLIERKRYLDAATRAYQTIGLIGVAEIDEKWVAAVQQQCWFLVAEAVSRNLLSLSDADATLPTELWGLHSDIDPFIDMDEPQLRVFLASGSEKLDEAALSPQIRPATGVNAAGRWSIVCNGASIEELLSRFATNAAINLQWKDRNQAAPLEENMRKRPVYLYLSSATAQQVAAIAAGSVGLLAQLDVTGTGITVLDPMSYSSLAEHTKLLAEESISLWQRFLLTADTDQRAPNGHFALGLLQTVRGQLDEAISEYKLVANRFQKHALAPHALLESGKLKVRLRDYVGAHEDLKQLVVVYPETDLADTACLALADATMKAGLFGEAAELYQKVYNLGLSPESQVSSALGAGRCAHEVQDHEETTRWLNRYVSLVRDQSRPEFHAACLLLGKAYLALGKPQQAHGALNLALKGDLSRQQYVETVGVLVKAYIQQGLLLEALETIEGTSGWQLSQQETIELLLLRAQVLRSIGLTDKATALLQEKGQFLTDPELKGRIALELAACLADNGDLEAARKTLSDAFATAVPGPVAQQIGRELAHTCLRLGQTKQAISVCSQLLEHAAGADKQAILDLLVQAYRKQGQYDRAMAAMLNRYDAATDPNMVRTPPGASITQ